MSFVCSLFFLNTHVALIDSYSRLQFQYTYLGAQERIFSFLHFVFHPPEVANTSSHQFRDQLVLSSPQSSWDGPELSTGEDSWSTFDPPGQLADWGLLGLPGSSLGTVTSCPKDASVAALSSMPLHYQSHRTLSDTQGEAETRLPDTPQPFPTWTFATSTGFMLGNSGRVSFSGPHQHPPVSQDAPPLCPLPKPRHSGWTDWQALLFLVKKLLHLFLCFLFLCGLVFLELRVREEFLSILFLLFLAHIPSLRQHTQSGQKCVCACVCVWFLGRRGQNLSGTPGESSQV